MIHNESKIIYKALTKLPGFLSDDALLLFRLLAKNSQSHGGAILEIGVFCGRSLTGLAYAYSGCKVVGVDPFFDNFTTSPAFHDEADHLKAISLGKSPRERIELLWSIVDEIEKISQKIFRSNISLAIKTQDEYLAEQKHKTGLFQLIHIDGEHNFNAVWNALEALPYLLLNHSIVIIDDFFNEGFPGISEAVYRHHSFKNKLWPVFFGFNKAVFYYGHPNDPELAALLRGLSNDFTSAHYLIRQISDGSLMGYRPHTTTVTTQKISLINRIFNRLTQL